MSVKQTTADIRIEEKNSIEALQLALNLGMERQFVLHTPLMLLDKAQTIIMAKDLGAL